MSRDLLKQTQPAPPTIKESFTVAEQSAELDAGMAAQHYCRGLWGAARGHSDWRKVHEHFANGYKQGRYDELQAQGPVAQQAEPVAWRIFDGEGGYDYRDEPPELFAVDWAARYGRKYEPLYATPQAPPLDGFGGNLDSAFDAAPAAPAVPNLVESHLIGTAPAVQPQDDCAPNHFCNRRFVHLPHGEQCDRCGRE